MTRREYGRGTYLSTTPPYGFYSGGRAMCSDGNVRALSWIAATADTAFSIPAHIKAYGKSIAGFIVFETAQGFDEATASDPTIIKFIANSYGRNANVLPSGCWKASVQEAQEGHKDNG